MAKNLIPTSENSSCSSAYLFFSLEFKIHSLSYSLEKTTTSVREVLTHPILMEESDVEQSRIKRKKQLVWDSDFLQNMQEIPRDSTEHFGKFRWEVLRNEET